LQTDVENAVPAEAGISSPPLLEVRNLGKCFVSKGLFRPTRRVTAAGNVSFRIDRGQALALVGESGSGKSTVARMLLRLETPDGGEIRLDGSDVLVAEPRRASLGYRGRVQMVFQDPFGSLNAVHSVAHHLERPLLRHRRANASNVRSRALDLLGVVGLEPAAEFIDRHPYELSGGQRQRVAIARALAVEPDLLVADEPTSMLDVSIRMDILNLLARLKRERRLAILLITHDLASARFLADRILVLFRGRVVEDGTAEKVVTAPAHPYTKALLQAIAGERGDAAHTRGLPGREASSGCPFAPRCSEIIDICRAEDPAPRHVDGRTVRCHLYPPDAPAQRG
jgi:peptide/nickel transport system ATP-binding protein